MDRRSRKSRDGVLTSLNVAIEAMDLAKEIASMTPVKAVFGSVSVVLTMIRVSPPLARFYQPLDDVYRIRWPTKPTTSTSA